MHFSNVIHHLPLSPKFRLFWERITFSRVTKFYFVFSVLHCVLQLVFQVEAFLINAQAADFLFKLILQGNATESGFNVMDKDGLIFCDAVPNTLSTTDCQVIWAPSGSTPVGGLSSFEGSSASPIPFSSTLSLATSTSIAAPTSSIASRTSSRSITASTSRPTVAIVAIDEDSDDESEFGDDSDDSDSEFGDDSDSEVGDDDDDDDDNELVIAVGAPENRLETRHNVEGLSLDSVSALISNGTVEVTVDGLGWTQEKLNLTQTCLFTLNWPVEVLDNTKREDVTFIVFQIWVLGMSVVALLNESMPHIIVSLLTHVLATAWGTFQVFSTSSFQESFNRLTTDGACGVNLIPTYWKARAAGEIPSVVLNAVALLLSAFLSWRLIKLFGWQTFKRVGASRTINRVYKLVLSLSIAIQLSFFFIVASIALWIDQLYNGSIGRMATEGNVYKGVLITVIILLFPWLTLGWIGVRREMRIPMMIFLAMSIGYLAGWGGMFAATTFRWTFVNWRFFSVIVSASLLLTIITVVLGFVCRLNFGKGLPRYLTAHERLADEEDLTPYALGGSADPEKVEFPTTRAGVPTFSAAFGRGAEVPPPSQMRFTPPSLGPRFSTPSLEPFEPQHGDEDAQPLPALSISSTRYSKPSLIVVDRDIGNETAFNTNTLSRQVSNASEKSFDSYKSGSSGASETGTYKSAKSKRWVIE